MAPRPSDAGDTAKVADWTSSTPPVGREVACQSDPDGWFPTLATGRADINRRKQLCATCWYQADCYQLAIKVNATAGIWGGVSIARDRQRRGGTKNVGRAIPPEPAPQPERRMPGVARGGPAGTPAAHLSTGAPARHGNP